MKSVFSAADARDEQVAGEGGEAGQGVGFDDLGEDDLMLQVGVGVPGDLEDSLFGGGGGEVGFSGEVIAQVPQLDQLVVGEEQVFEQDGGASTAGDAGLFEDFALGGLGQGFTGFHAPAGGDQEGRSGGRVADEQDLAGVDDDAAGGDALVDGHGGYYRRIPGAAQPGDAVRRRDGDRRRGADDARTRPGRPEETGGDRINLKECQAPGGWPTFRRRAVVAMQAATGSDGMSATTYIQTYRRPVTPVERFFRRSPFSVVSMTARIRGRVDETLLREAVAKAQMRHPNLRVRIRDDEQGLPWFMSDGAGEVEIRSVARQAETDWIGAAQAACMAPFDFEERPAVRFVLVQAPEVSELVIACHHILCDGLSLAYLARDLLGYLGNPGAEVEMLPDPQPVTPENIPPDVRLNGLVRFVIGRMNRQWQSEQVTFDEEDYREVTAAYWQRYPHQVLGVELDEGRTKELVERCWSKGVTVNSALSTAFLAAQREVLGEKAYLASIAVAASLRERLQAPAGEGMGFYAGMVRAKFNYDRQHPFWYNTRNFNHKVRPLFTNRELFQNPRLWWELDPTILEAMNFKKLGGLVAEGAARQAKLAAFSRQEDTVGRILKRERMDTLERINIGTAVTNLTRLDFPSRYGDLELERLMMKPGAGFPLSTVNLVLGAVTCAGRLSLVLEFVEDNVRMGQMEAIRERALELLREE